MLEYSVRELATWATALQFQREHTLQLAADELRAGHERLRAGGLLSDHRIPSLRELNAYLRATSGFTLRPVASTLRMNMFTVSIALNVPRSTNANESETELRQSAACVRAGVPHLRVLLRVCARSARAARHHSRPFYAGEPYARSLTCCASDAERRMHLSYSYSMFTLCLQTFCTMCSATCRC